MGQQDRLEQGWVCLEFAVRVDHCHVSLGSAQQLRGQSLVDFKDHSIYQGVDRLYEAVLADYLGYQRIWQHP